MQDQKALKEFRMSLSAYHLLSAHYFATLSLELEKKWNKDNWQDFRDENTSYVMATIFACCAFLEAHINELYSNSLDAIKRDSVSFHDELTKKTAALWSQDGVERLSMLEKYQVALISIDHARFNKGKAPFQDISLLVKFRNYLIHYQPRWLSISKPHALRNSFARKFDLHPFITDSELFPFTHLTHSCGKWATDATLSFADEFCRRIGRDPNYRILLTQVNK